MGVRGEALHPLAQVGGVQRGVEAGFEGVLLAGALIAEAEDRLG